MTKAEQPNVTVYWRQPHEMTQSEYYDAEVYLVNSRWVRIIRNDGSRLLVPARSIHHIEVDK